MALTSGLLLLITAAAASPLSIQTPQGRYACPDSDALAPTTNHPLSICAHGGRPLTAADEDTMKDLVLNEFYRQFAAFVGRKIFTSYAIDLLDSREVAEGSCMNFQGAMRAIGTDGAMFTHQTAGDAFDSLNSCFGTLGLEGRMGDLARTVSNFSCRRKVADQSGGACPVEFESAEGRKARRQRRLAAFKENALKLRTLGQRLAGFRTDSTGAAARSVAIDGQEVSCATSMLPNRSCRQFIDEMVACQKSGFAGASCVDPSRHELEPNLDKVWKSFTSLTTARNEIESQYPELMVQIDKQKAFEKADAILDQSSGGCAYELQQAGRCDWKLEGLLDDATQLARRNKVRALFEQVCDNPDNPRAFALDVMAKNPAMLTAFLKEFQGADRNALACLAVEDGAARRRFHEITSAILGGGAAVLGALAFIPSGGSSAALIIGGLSTAVGVGLAGKDLAEAFADAKRERGLQISCLGDYDRLTESLEKLDSAATSAILTVGQIPAGYFAESALERIAELRRLRAESRALRASKELEAGELESIETTVGGGRHAPSTASTAPTAPAPAGKTVVSASAHVPPAAPGAAATRALEADLALRRAEVLADPDYFSLIKTVGKSPEDRDALAGILAKLDALHEGNKTEATADFYKVLGACHR